MRTATASLFAILLFSMVPIISIPIYLQDSKEFVAVFFNII